LINRPRANILQATAAVIGMLNNKEGNPLMPKKNAGIKVARNCCGKLGILSNVAKLIKAKPEIKTILCNINKIKFASGYDKLKVEDMER
tara:strand:+ start:275 stop:541 length:267 start_codon:yes stop_codon:yes gene_type:complete